MPLARSGPKANFFPFGSAQAISPACLAGRGPFVQFLQSTLQCSTWNFFSSVLPLARSRPKVFSFPPARSKKPARPVWQGGGLLSDFLQSTIQMFHVELFLRSCLWPSAGRRLFSFPPARPKKPARPVRRGGDLLPDYTPKPIQMFHMEHFSPFKMAKSRVLCALLVSIPLQVCYNNRRSPFSG